MILVWLACITQAPDSEVDDTPDPCDPVLQQTEAYATERLSVDFWYRCWNGPEEGPCGWRLMMEGEVAVSDALTFAEALEEDSAVDGAACGVIAQIDDMQAAYDDVRVVWQCHAVQGGCTSSWLIAYDNAEVARDGDFAEAVAEAHARL